MRRRRGIYRTIRLLAALILLAGLVFPAGLAAAEDTSAFYYTAKYRNMFTKENLDAICRDYNLKSGKYWCVKENTLQTFKGIDTKGKTRGGDTSGGNAKAAGGYYGCVWPGEYANEENYNDWRRNHTDCDGFTKFIGYLLTGVVNFREEPTVWNKYTEKDGECAIDAAGGLKTGDMISSDGHVAVVYTVSATQVTVIECWGSWSNQIAVGGGFNGRKGNLPISKLKGMIRYVFRAKANDGEAAGDPKEKDTEPAAEQEPDVPQAEEKKTVPGDVNGDGAVDGRDTIRLMKYLAGETDPETGRVYTVCEKNADVTGDGNVDEKDLLRLVQYLGGKDVTLG